ncbi:MAG: hypothetical protein Q9217_000269 [Psora testacea]
MFRLRRYRVFLVFTIIVIGLLYHFTTIGDFETAGTASVEGLRHFGQKVESSAGKSKDTAANGANDRSNAHVPEASLVDFVSAKPSSAVNQEPKRKTPPAAPKGKEPSKGVKSPKATGPPPPLNGGNRAAAKSGPEDPLPKAAPTDHPYLGKPTTTDKTAVTKEGPADPIIGHEDGKGRLEVIADENAPKIHWSQLPEHFPVPTDSLIQLPSGKPKAIPKVQYDFSSEKSQKALVEQDKLDIIKKAFSFSWAGYRQKAWMQDELSPLSGKYRNPFCGWGATLVDSLDTLWMMDLKDEFEEAVESVKDINFTTSIRNDIPLFETVIRYLGGLVAAYDISEGAHRILLDKAVELADILMGAFDTPNRMPMTFYLWKPTFASQPHRAKTRVVLAELGSLSLEFTRLAQITKEARFYDAIARITNEFEIWQNNTKLPGLWPLKVDASGCKKPDAGSSTFGHSTQSEPKNNRPLTLPEKAAANRAAAANPDILDGGPALKDESESRQASSNSDEGNVNAKLPNRPTSTLPTQDGSIKRRGIEIEPSPPSDSEDQPKEPDCEPQGLASPPYSDTEEFSLGGQADSVYEYLPKEYMLLGGLEDKYRSMYEMAADVAKEHLLFRPMIPDEKRIIFQSGTVQKTAIENPGKEPNFRPEGTHLTCFMGGMFAIGAKIFDRKVDLDVAKKLTDGCVWAYEATNTGIMPESYLSIACEKIYSCPWNETMWHEKLDPFGYQREQKRLKQQNQQVLSDESKTTNPIEGAETPPLLDDAKAADREKTVKNDVERKTPQSAEEIATEADAEATAERAKLAKSKAGKPSVDSLESHQSKSLESPFKGLGDASEEPQSKPRQQDVGASDRQLSLGPGTPKAPEPDTDKTDGKSSLGAGPPKEPLRKRQLGEIEKTPPGAGLKSADSDLVPSKGPSEVNLSDKSKRPQDMTQGPVATARKSAAKAASLEAESKTLGTNTNTTSHAAKYSTPRIPTREEYVAGRIKDERLPTGMTKVTGSRYLLRPEAIESVFIMYRTTGDGYWREKGWEMFKAIEKHTLATYGASAISDVTAETPKLVDEMESFWLAETLKYFYLLYSDPSVVSLDDFVL